MDQVNVDLSGSLSPGGAVTFPGGGYLVINAGGEAQLAIVNAGSGVFLTRDGPHRTMYISSSFCTV